MTLIHCDSVFKRRGNLDPEDIVRKKAGTTESQPQLLSGKGGEAGCSPIACLGGNLALIHLGYESGFSCA